MSDNNIKQEASGFNERLKQFKNLPEELRNKPVFCLCEMANKDGKPAKRPFNALTNKYIDESNYSNPDMYTSMEEIQKRMSPYLDYDLAVGLRYGICAMELDQCIDENGDISNEAADIMNKLHSYTEKTPGGTGLRIFFKAPGLQFDENQYDTSNPDIGFEVYMEGHTCKCATVTGDAVTQGLGIEERSTEFQEVLGMYLKKEPDTDAAGQSAVAIPPPTQSAAPLPQTPAQQPVTSPANVAAGRVKMDDFEVVSKAKSATNGKKFSSLMDGDMSKYGGDRIKAVMALLCILVYWTCKDAKQVDRIFRTSKLMWPGWDAPDANNPCMTTGEAAIISAMNYIKDVYAPQAYLKRSAEELTVHTPDGDILLSNFKPEERRYGSYGWNDMGIARTFADTYKYECRYVNERKCWYCYDGRVWKPDDGMAMESMKEFIEALTKYARGLPVPKDAEKDTTRADYIKFIERLQTRRSRETILKDAASVYPVSINEFDKEPYVLNVLNGELDLKNMILNPHRASSMLTKIAGVRFDAQAKCERWEQHMDEVTGGDAGLKQYMQKAFGYALTGSTRYECFFVLFGPTSRNGKGTTMETIVTLIGDYGKAAKPESIAQKCTPNASGPSEDIARLAGARMVNISEPDKKMMLSSSLIKTLTGNDTVTARYLHENSFEYRPSYKIFINSNYLPLTNDLTVFRSGRVKVIPFNQVFKGDKQDKGLKEKLRSPESLSGILNWCIEGLKLLENTGFEEPQAVIEAVNEYEYSSDKIGQFIEDMMDKNPNGEIPTEEAHKIYEAWCKNRNYFVESPKTFNQSIETHGGMIKRKRPADKQNLGKNPRMLILGFSWKKGVQILPHAQYTSENQEM